MNKAGIGRVHARATGELAHEDAGWVLRDEKGLHATQLAKTTVSRQDGSYLASGRMGIVQQEQLTPLRFLVLRVLNLTLFRSEALGRWIRRLVIERLITRVPQSPYVYDRAIRLEKNRIIVYDDFDNGGPPVLSLELVRDFTAIHMGSAKTFHPSALRETPSVDIRDAADELMNMGMSSVTFEVRFDAS
jgi:hypothetical protein